jgi:hypothetical protein
MRDFPMTAINIRSQSSQFEETIRLFQAVDGDCQLAVLWQTYEALGPAFAAVAPVALFSQAVQQLIKQITQLRREEQLEILHEILSGAETRFTHAYQGLNTNMKLAFWHRLFGRPEWQQIERRVGCQADVRSLVARLSVMGLNERIHFLRQVVA